MVWHRCSGAGQVIGSENATGFNDTMRFFPPCRNTIENTLRPNAGLTCVSNTLPARSVYTER